MAKVQDKRQEGVAIIAQHGKALKEAAHRMEMHTATFPINTEAGRIMDSRIIVEEIRIIQNRCASILIALLEAE